MSPQRFNAITQKYRTLRIAVVGDFCLDRYLEIDPALQEISVETGLPVHNVTRVRTQPGGAGTVLNNLAALGLLTIFPIGFAGEDGEGYELRRAMAELRGVSMEGFVATRQRQTFTYCKPLLNEPGKTPRELNRLDRKNWTATPAALTQELCDHVARLSEQVDAFVLLGQVGIPETGVLTAGVLAMVGRLAQTRPERPFLADSRLGLRDFPKVIFKMNSFELAGLAGIPESSSVDEMSKSALDLARRNGQPVFVTLAARGIFGVMPDGTFEHRPALPVRGEIDVVGAGDAVSANLIAALAAGATMPEALELANAAASLVIHQLGTTGTATVEQLRALYG